MFEREQEETAKFVQNHEHKGYANHSVHLVSNSDWIIASIFYGYNTHHCCKLSEFRLRCDVTVSNGGVGSHLNVAVLFKVFGKDE